MSPSFTVHGGQHDTKYVSFESLMHAAFVDDEIWGSILELTQGACPTPCRLYGSHAATRARSYRIRNVSAVNDLDHEL